MTNLNSFRVILLTIIVLIDTKVLASADKTDQNIPAAESSSARLNLLASDNICNNNERNVAFDVVLIDNFNQRSKREAPQNHRKRPRADQKSLLIIFDGTGSMYDDLQQLQFGANEIINDLSSRNDSPIFNYVLVVYRDPNVDPPFDTENPTELLEKLKTIHVNGGGDCPELALNGLRIALEFALPNSIAYVFSDATAKDHGFYSDVVELIQKKQVTVNFLLTGDCNSQDSFGYQVYHKLSRVSNGQVYDMNKNNVKDVLLAIRQSVSHNYAALKSLDVEQSGTSHTDLNVDKSISELSVRISGRNPKLSIVDPSNMTVSDGEELSLQNLKLVNIKDPKDGLWRIEAGADSAHSVRLSGTSDLKFDFGFSAGEISRKFETSVRPLAGEKNVLSIFISDPSLIETLSNVTIILVPTNPSDAPVKFSIPLSKIDDQIFVTKPFEVPRQMFKIQLFGTDAGGNAIERLISTGLIANNGNPPEVNIEVTRTEIFEGESLNLKCLVNSQISSEAFWSLNGKMLTKKLFNKSSEFLLQISDETQNNQGIYKCSAINKFGNDSQEVFITILKYPKVRVSKDDVEFIENQEYSLRCNIDNVNGKYSISWFDQRGDLLQNNSPIYKFTAKAEDNKKKITCRISSDDFVIENSTIVEVYFAPKFLERNYNENNSVKFGESIQFGCKTSQNPQTVETQWFFTKKSSNMTSQIISHGSELVISKADENHEGAYACVAKNKVGKVSRSILLEVDPKEPPIVVVNSDIIIANETDSIEISCACNNCLPILNFSWHVNEFQSANYEQFSTRDELNNLFKTVLKIKSADETDNGSFHCLFENKLGEGNATVELLVQSKARIESFVQNEREIKEKLEILEGRNLSLECVFDGYPEPIVVWQKEQENIVHDATLELINVQESHSGVYECYVSNILGASKKSVELSVISQPKSKSNQATTIEAIEGKSVEIICDLTGKPEPAIHWKFNSKEIKSNEKYLIENKNLKFVASVDDSGIFNCLGVNNHGKTSIDFTLVVFTHPKILSPDDETVSIRKSTHLSLKCDAVGFPEPQVYFIEDEQILSNSSDLKVNSLSDSGIFHCIAKNEVGTAEKLFYVNVVEEPKIISNFDNVTLLTNQTKKINCFASGIPAPKVTWRFEDGSQMSSNSYLELSSVSKSGKYSCIVENSQGIDSKSFHVDIINQPKILPFANDLTTSIKIKANDDLELLCPFDNFNQISWRLNNNSISNLEHKLIDRKLIVHNIDDAYNGEWTCFASNIAGSESFSYQVTVLASPTIFASWNLHDRGISDFLVTESDIDERVFKRGENLTLNCTSVGTPRPKVVWRKSGDVIGEGDVLAIENLQFYHSDIYTCTAENAQGSRKKFFKIEVISPPVIDPEVNIQKDFQKQIGDSVMLRTSVIANPPPLYFWFKDNELLDDETDDHLEIDSLELSHDGNYRCLAKNKFGSVKMNYQISMYESAKIVKAFEEEKLSRNDDSLRLSCTSRGNPLPILSWTQNGHVLSTTSKLNIEKLFKASPQDDVIYFDGFGNGISYLNPFEVKLSKQKFYSQLARIDAKTLKLEIVFKSREKLQNTKFTCYSFNALGRDEKSIDITINRKPYVKERNQRQSGEIEILEHLPLLLTCLIDGEPEPKITWHKNGLPVYENETLKLINNGKFLSIAESYSWHSGNYSCVVKNSEGELEIKFSVIILAPPKFSDYTVRSIDSRFYNDKTKIIKSGEHEEVIHALKGEDVILECWIEASPKPSKIHWVKLNFDDSKKNEILLESGNVLTINSIEESSSYLCYVNNTIGNVQRLFFIDVQYPPKFVDDKIEERLAVKLNHGMNFECKVKASPEAIISWSFNSTNITKNVNDYYFSSNNDIMRIVSVNKKHEGKFICTASNDHGSAQKVFYVTIEIPIQFSPWNDWSACSATCGNSGIQYRSRTCILLDGNPSYNCSGENMQMRKCNDLNCPINGGYGNFSKWSKCPSCFNENQEKPRHRRFRKCDSPAPAFGGLNCEGSDVDERECEINFCPIHGGWSEWKDWGECSKTCGRGIRTRKRFCNNPTPKHNGRQCDGENFEYEECKVTICSNFDMRRTMRNELENSEESTERFREFAEFEMIRNNAGEPKIFQFSQHREVEFSAPPPDPHKISKIKVTLDTYRPISAETYNQHLNQEDDYFEPEFLDSTEYSSIEFTSKPVHNCGRGFKFNLSLNQCEEIDECKLRELNSCKANERCINTVGSYRCEKRN